MAKKTEEKMSKKPVTRSQTKKLGKTQAKGKKRSRSDRKEEDVVQENLKEFLDGLTLSKNGKNIIIDENLLRRLKHPSEVEVFPKRNPLENSPTFLETMKEGTPLTLDFLTECSVERRDDPDAVRMGEIVGNLPVDWLALKNSAMLEDNWDYNSKLMESPKVVDQNNSGRCWLFSSLAYARYLTIRKFHIEYKFEFSETYLYFYDKIERGNLFLEHMWTLRDRDLQDREVRMFTSPSSHILEDGGYFHTFMCLVKKYGLVPKNVYGESFNSKTSAYMNETLISVINNMALEIFRNKDKWDREDFEEKKYEYNTTIYDLMVRFLGEPPKPDDNFTWTFKNEHGELQSVPNLTPRKFYQTVIPHEHETKVVIINDPRHPETYFQTSFMESSLTMIGGELAKMINLPMDVFKKIVCENLKNESPVWFACDMGKCFDCENYTSDPKRFDYKSVLGTDVHFDKGDMLEMMTSVPNHAMLFNGVDTIEDKEGNVTGYKKWRVDNSWGMYGDIEDQPDLGFYRFSDDYMDKFVYEAVVDMRYFDEDVIKKFLENEKEGNFYVYKATDAFGTVARRKSCQCCQKKLEKRPGFNKK
jgi:bleomycin hydrolase